MKTVLIASTFALMTGPAFAATMATADAIMANIIGNTVQGDMSGGEAYSEFYSADGEIKAEGYSGTWSIEADSMCFDYGEGAYCLTVQLDGDEITWVSDGEEAGKGTISEGNPNGF